jgi:hypothetical protein
LRDGHCPSLSITSMVKNTFKHSGDLGDIIYSMPTIKALGGGIVYLNPGKPLKKPIYGIPTKKFTSTKSIDLIKPLLLSQEYITDVLEWNGQEVTYDLDQFRNRGMKLSHTNLAQAHLRTFNLDENLMNKQWLHGIGKKTVMDKTVVFHRSPRYHNKEFNWNRYIKDYGKKAVMIGIKDEYDAFVKQYKCPYIPFYQVSDFLESAEIINGAELFVGNQSSPFAIAEGLHAPSVLENSLSDPNCNFERDKIVLPEIKFIESKNEINRKPMIHTYITYAPSYVDKNIGWAYNNFMKMVPDDDWVCFLDHDAMFTTGDWYKQLEEIVSIAEKTPDNKIGLLTSLTNRIGNEEQIIFKKDSEEAKNHDMYFHRKWGRSQQKYHRTSLQKAKNLISGVVMLFPKKVWLKTNGFKDGFLGVDNDFDQQVRRAGYSTYIMKGVYTYHWYRADANPDGLIGWGYSKESLLPPMR